MTAPCRINARKFDGSIHRSWTADLVDENPDLFVLVGTFEHEVNHPDLGRIPIGTVSREFYWKNRNFNVFRFESADGAFMFFYCNINLPPVIGDRVLDYVDLDIDLLVRGRADVKILDEDDFENNRDALGYGDDIVMIAKNAVAELKEMIAAGVFPFEDLPD
jgi:protein associated with RNAse G/E